LGRRRVTFTTGRLKKRHLKSHLTEKRGPGSQLTKSLLSAREKELKTISDWGNK